MPTVQHKTLTDPDLHEPKGVSSATNGQVYVADGAGSGAWKEYPTATETLKGILLKAATVAALTDSTTGTADGTVSDVGTAFSQAILNDNFAEVTVKINAILTALKNAGIMT